MIAERQRLKKKQNLLILKLVREFIRFSDMEIQIENVCKHKHLYRRLLYTFRSIQA